MAKSKISPTTLGEDGKPVGAPCGDPEFEEFYCKYDTVGGGDEWRLVEAVTPSGYYCPTAEFFEDPLQCAVPIPYQFTQVVLSASPLAAQEVEVDIVHGERDYVRYEHFGNGEFFVVQAHSEGSKNNTYCPITLDEYLGNSRGLQEELVAWLKGLQELMKGKHPAESFVKGIVVRPALGRPRTITPIDADIG